MLDKLLLLLVDFKVLSHHEILQVAHHVRGVHRIGLALDFLVLLFQWEVSPSYVLDQFLFLDTVLLLYYYGFANIVGVVYKITLEVVE